MSAIDKEGSDKRAVLRSTRYAVIYWETVTPSLFLKIQKGGNMVTEQRLMELTPFEKYPCSRTKRTMVTKVDLAYYDEVSDPLVTIYCIEFPGLIGQILPCNDEDHNFVFVTEKPAGIIHSNYGHFYHRAVGEEVSSVVQDYPIPLSLSPMSPCDTIFAFGNRNYELCRIRVVKTRDWGFVTTIEEIK